jgi:hypothetical protein
MKKLVLFDGGLLEWQWQRMGIIFPGNPKRLVKGNHKTLFFQQLLAIMVRRDIVGKAKVK